MHYGLLLQNYAHKSPDFYLSFHSFWYLMSAMTRNRMPKYGKQASGLVYLWSKKTPVQYTEEEEEEEVTLYKQVSAN